MANQIAINVRYLETHVPVSEITTELFGNFHFERPSDVKIQRCMSCYLNVLDEYRNLWLNRRRNRNTQSLDKINEHIGALQRMVHDYTTHNDRNHIFSFCMSNHPNIARFIMIPANLRPPRNIDEETKGQITRHKAVLCNLGVHFFNILSSAAMMYATNNNLNHNNITENIGENNIPTTPIIVNE